MAEKGNCGCKVERVELEPDGGGDVRPATIFLDVRGMGCVNCANRVYNALARTPGVIAAEVQLEAATVPIGPGRPLSRTTSE